MRSLWRLGISSVFQRRSRTILLLIAVVALSATLIAAVGVATGTLRLRNPRTRRWNAGPRRRSHPRQRHRDDLRRRPRSGQQVRTWPEVAKAAGRSTRPITLRFGALSGTARRGRDSPAKPRTWTRSTAAFGLTDGAAEMTRGLELIAGRMPETDDEIVLDQMLVERLSQTDNEVRIGMGGLSMLFRDRDDALPSEPMKADNGPEFANAEQAEALNAGSKVAVGDRVEAIRAKTAARTLRVVGIAAAPPLGGTPKAYMTSSGLGVASGRPGRLSRIDIVLNQGVPPMSFVDQYAPTLPKRAMAETTEKVTSGLDRNLRANQMGFAVASMMAFLAAAFIIMTGLSVGVTERQRELAVLRCIGAARWQLAVAQLIGGATLGACGAVVGVPLGAALAAIMIRRYHDVLKADLVLEPSAIIGAAAGAVFAGVIGAAWPAWQAARVSPLQALTVRAKRVKTSTLIKLAVASLACILIHLAIFTVLGEGQHIFWSYVSVGLPALMIGYFLLGVPATIAVVFVLGGVIERVLALPRHMLRRAVRATPYRFGFTAGAMMASFVAFEPEAFFRMTRVDWVQGDPKSAIERLKTGGAVIVSREFLVARGQGVGDTFVCWDEDETRHEFEIVGVVSSPGLEVANDVFDVGEDFTQQRVHAVFGSRTDLLDKFHTDTIGLLQFTMAEGIDDDEAMMTVKQALAPYGVMHAGSGRGLKQTLQGFVKTTLLVASCVAIFSMLIASFSVANVIVAGVQSRMFEFGVIRAVGGSGGVFGVLTRLVIAEVLVIVIAACALGTLMGTQGAFGGLVLNRIVWGLELALKPPVVAIALGWLTLLVIAVGAAAPAVISLAKKQPRELLGAVRG